MFGFTRSPLWFFKPSIFHPKRPQETDFNNMSRHIKNTPNLIKSNKTIFVDTKIKYFGLLNINKETKYVYVTVG